MLTIGQVAKMCQLPVSTLRYYDKEGLFPAIQRVNGIRYFSEKELDTLQITECLKQSGLDIPSIKQFIDWCDMGSATYRQRLELFQNQQQAVLAQLEKINEVLETINFKCWYYENAIKDGNEDRVAKFNKENYQEN